MDHGILIEDCGPGTTPGGGRYPRLGCDAQGENRPLVGALVLLGEDWS